MKVKVPHVFEAADTGRPLSKKDYNPFGNGSETWKIFYFFRHRKNSRVGLYSNYGRTEEEALVSLVRAIRNDWLNSIYRNRTPGRNKITSKSSYVRQFECVPAEKFIAMCRKLKRRELLKETLRENNVNTTTKNENTGICSEPG